MCLNYIKFPLLPPEIGTLKNSADCQGGNSQPTPELTIVSAKVKCYGIGFKKPTRGPLSPLNQQLYRHTASHSAAVGIVDEPCWEIDRSVAQDMCVYCREVLIKMHKSAIFSALEVCNVHFMAFYTPEWLICGAKKLSHSVPALIPSVFERK